jgi:glycosyltransferase involved in cell wall biosynthesis
MRIGIIAPPWLPVPPPAYGGTESMLDRLARGLQAAGHDVLLCTTGDATCPVPRAAVLERAETVRMGHSVPEVRHVVHAYEALAGFDVVHDHTVVGPLYAERFPGRVVVTTNHGPFSGELNDLYAAMGHRVPVIAISHDQASRAAPGVWLAGVVHHGIDAEDVPVGAGDGGYLLFLGRMAPEKGARRAAEIARAAGKPLLIAAKMREPLEIRYFEDEVRPLLGRGVEYVGEVGPRRKLELLAGAAALLNPIRWPEPFGLVMIEALACGTPVIAYKEGAAPEIVEHGVTGWLCADEADMAAAVERVDELDRRACRAAAEGPFSTARMVADHVEVYRRAIAGQLPRRPPARSSAR